MALLKYLSKFWKTLEMPLINCEINLQLKWSEKCILVAGIAGNQVQIFTKTDTKILRSKIKYLYNLILKEQLIEININQKKISSAKQIFFN